MSPLVDGIEANFLNRLRGEVNATGQSSRVVWSPGSTIPAGYARVARSRPSCFRASVEWCDEDPNDGVIAGILLRARAAALHVAPMVARTLRTLRYGEDLALGVVLFVSTRETSDLARTTGVESCLFDVHATRIQKDPPA